MPFLKNPYANRVQGINVSKKGDKSRSAAVKSGCAKLLDEMHRTKTPASNTSLPWAAGQNGSKERNPYASMLSDVLPGVGGLKNPVTAKRSAGAGVETKLKPKNKTLSSNRLLAPRCLPPVQVAVGTASGRARVQPLSRSCSAGSKHPNSPPIS